MAFRYVFLDESEIEEMEAKSSDELMEKAEKDWDKKKVLAVRRPMTEFKEIILAVTSSKSNELQEMAEIGFLKLPSPPTTFSLPTNFSLWQQAYKARYMYTQSLFVRITKSFEKDVKHAIAHELVLSDKFNAVTPKIYKLGPQDNQMFIASEHFPLSLKDLMRKDLSTIINIPSEIAEILATFADQRYLLREFRVEKFLAKKCK